MSPEPLTPTALERPGPARVGRRSAVLRSPGARSATVRFVGALSVGVLSLVGMAVGLWLAAAPAGAAPPREPDAARTPFGEMNLAWTEPGMIGLVGWAKDPDVDRPIDVVVGITDGGGLHRRTAGVFNPFLPGTTLQKYRSYLIAIPVSPGPKTMCVAALNVGRGAASRLLGCQSFVVPSADPSGVVESAVPDPAGEAVRVTGWTVDPESSNSLAVDVFVDGVVTRIGSTGDRPDLAGAFPGLGTAHGFAGSVPASVGRHRVCVLARNVGRGGDRFLDCRDVVVPATVPIGSLDLVTTGPSGFRVAGWAADADASSASVRVSHQLVGDIGDPTAGIRPANGIRDDVATATGLSRTAGFDASVVVGAPGRYRVCVDAVNVGPGRDRPLGCGEVTVGDRRPLVAVDTFSLVGNSVRLSGWAADRAGTAPVTVRMRVDGTVVTTQVASIPRPDVVNAVPGARGDTGYDLTVGPLSTGSHQVCPVYSGTGGAIDGAVSGDLAAACASVVIGSISSIVTTPPGAGDVVGPESGPLVDIDRDAGVSTRLRDGSMLWLFGDSSARNADGSLRYFVSGTGAWANNNRPSYTLDAVAPGGKPYVLAAPGPAFPGCTLPGASPALWPMSAVTVPLGSVDRVIVFLANMCLVDEDTFEFRGVAIGEWFYDPANPPANRPVQLALVNQQMGMARSWGTAAVLGDDGLLYVYQCDRPANPANLGGFGPCRVARVDPVTVGEPATYRFWNGSTWVVNDPNVAMDMPAGTAAGYRYPASSFTVMRLSNGGYAMGYSPWPGFVDRMAIRFSRTPTGPWTSPLEIPLAGCNEVIGGETKSCYAATLQPAAGNDPQYLLGIGWYDQASAPDRRGQYRIANLSVRSFGW